MPQAFLNTRPYWDLDAIRLLISNYCQEVDLEAKKERFRSIMVDFRWSGISHPDVNRDYYTKWASVYQNSHNLSQTTRDMLVNHISDGIEKFAKFEEEYIDTLNLGRTDRMRQNDITETVFHMYRHPQEPFNKLSVEESLFSIEEDEVDPGEYDNGDYYDDDDEETPLDEDEDWT